MQTSKTSEEKIAINKRAQKCSYFRAKPKAITPPNHAAKASNAVQAAQILEIRIAQDTANSELAHQMHDEEHQLGAGREAATASANSSK